MKKYEGLDGIRAFACIGIVLMHILTNISFDINNSILNTIIKSFTNFVFIFMTLSAFSMCCGYYDEVKNGHMDIEKFYKKRFLKILPFFTLLLIINIIFEFKISVIIEAFADFTLMFGFIQKNIEVIGVAWFLGLVFIFYFMFPFFVFLFSNKKRGWITTIVAIIMNFIGVYYFQIGRTNMFYSFVYFCLGGLLFLYKDAIIQYFKKNKFLLPIFLIVSILVYYSNIVPEEFLLLKVSPLVIFSIIWGITNNSIFLNNKLTKIIGLTSMEIYLSHMLIFRVIEKINFNRYINNVYLSYIIICILVICGSIILAKGYQQIITLIKKEVFKNENTFS